MNEATIMNHIRIAISPFGTYFRINTGKGKTYDGRHFDTGTPQGYSDLTGFTRVGNLAVFTAIEIKTGKGRTTLEQERFLEHIKKNGGIAFVARSTEEVIEKLTHAITALSVN
jgi:predicted Holliday junction resolvase-like endonuclease